MNAIILAAGFGTRLKPWTDSHPKALVPVGGIPMLERVVTRLEESGFDEIVINIHHHGQQIKDFIDNRKNNANIIISDESEKILDTGGGVLKAGNLFKNSTGPVLIHNVDILSDAPLQDLMRMHNEYDHEISLITSERESSRKLIFNEKGTLIGWLDSKNNRIIPDASILVPENHLSAFSGIYIIGEKGFKALAKYKEEIHDEAFPIMNYFLTSMGKIKINEIKLTNLNLIDIGKPDTLKQAENLIKHDDGHCEVHEC